MVGDPHIDPRDRRRPIVEHVEAVVDLSIAAARPPGPDDWIGLPPARFQPCGATISTDGEQQRHDGHADRNDGDDHETRC